MNNFEYHNIKSIKKIKKANKVYDITTRSHTLVVNNIHTHNCSGHSLEYVKLNGIRNVPNITSTSGPAKSAVTLARHLCSITQFYSSIFAGAIGWEAVNVFFAPFIINMGYSEVKQLAQTMMFDLSQLAGAKGGQISFTDFNLYITIPEHYRNTYAIFPGVQFKGIDLETKIIEEFNTRDDLSRWVDVDSHNRKAITYGDLEKEAQMMLAAFLEIGKEGDYNHLPFAFPKLNLHINESTFKEYKVHHQSERQSRISNISSIIERYYKGVKRNQDEEDEVIFTNREYIRQFEEKGYIFAKEESDTSMDLLYKAAEVSSVNGSIYFLFDRDEFSMSQCCRLKMKFDEDDKKLTKTPEHLRFVGLQNVSINLPRIALEHKDEESFYNELQRVMTLAAEAHVLRKEYLHKLTLLENSPIKFYAKGMDGKPYVNLEKSSCLIGVVGLNECIYNLMGSEMHESDEAFQRGMEIISFMKIMCDQLGASKKLNLKLEETPAESTAMRFAQIDNLKYSESAFTKGDDHQGRYYTNSIHFAYDCDMPYLERLQKQSKFHPLFDAGSMLHLWVGDRLPTPGAIVDVVSFAWYKTVCEQLDFTPELTSCKNCKATNPGFREVCVICGSENVIWYTRVTGYFVEVKKMNRGKRSELSDRNHDAYIIKERLK